MRRARCGLIARLPHIACGILMTGAASTSAIEPTIVYPTADALVFGDITVIVEVESAEPIAFVQLLVDGAPAGRRSEPPFTFEVSLGEENIRHRFEVHAADTEGERSSTWVVTSVIRVDDFVGLSLRQAFATVTDRHDRRVLDLKSTDFQIYDDGRLQQAVTFAGGEIPFSAILLIDGSQSMLGPQISAARAGARAFLSAMNDLDEAKVIVFSGRLLAASPFSGRNEPLSRLVEEVVPDGGTAINDFMFLALQRLEERHGRRVLVLLSDGWDLHSVLEAQQLQGIARQSQAQIYWLRLSEERSISRSLVNSWRNERSNKAQFRILERIVAESGGRVLAVRAVDEIETAFKEVIRELREQYALGYYPDRTFADGRWHQLQIKVRGNFKVKHREGYLDLP